MARASPKCPCGLKLSGRHARIPGELIPAFVALDNGQQQVLLAILLHANVNGHAYPGYQTIHEISGLSHPAIPNALKRLKANGWIDWISGGGRGKSNDYKLPFLGSDGGDGGQAANAIAQDEGVSDPRDTLVQDKGVSAATNTLDSSAKHPRPKEKTPSSRSRKTLVHGKGLTGNTEKTNNNRQSGVVVDGVLAGVQEASESVELLREFGVSESVAHRLAGEYAEARIKEVVDAAKRMGKGAGWIVKALDEEWNVVQLDSSPQKDPSVHKGAIEDAKQWGELLCREQRQYIAEVVCTKCRAARVPSSGDEDGTRVFWNGVIKGRREGWFPELHMHEPNTELAGE